jgi:hypothetical protein
MFLVLNNSYVAPSQFVDNAQNAKIEKPQSKTGEIQLKKSEPKVAPKKLVGLALGALTLAGIGCAAYMSRIGNGTQPHVSKQGMSLFSESPASKVFSVERCLPSDKKLPHVPGLIEQLFVSRKNAWGIAEESFPKNVCNPWNDCKVRKAYQEMDRIVGEEGSKSLSAIGYPEMLEEAKSLGLKLNPQGWFPYKDEVDRLKWKELNDKQFKGMEIATDACRARALINKPYARELTSGCGNLMAKGGDLLRSGRTQGFDCDYYAKKAGYNATKLVGSSAKTNEKVNGIMGLFC